MLRLEGVEIAQENWRLTADLALAAGSSTALIGPSGAGKSTILNAIAGFVAPVSGRILWEGADLTGRAPADRPVTLLFQEDVTSAAPPADPVAALMLRALGNPIDGPTDIRFALPQAGSYTLSVLDLRGREVRRIRQGSADAGEHLAVWNGRDDAGRPLPSGSYLLRLRTPRGEAVRSVAVVR